jgi:UDP-glucose 4-epimerase
METILITGGLGYIGSHVAREICRKQVRVILYDNCINSDESVYSELQKIISYEIIFVHGDILDTEKLINTLNKYKVDYVMHFAGLKSVPESNENPINYYKNNICGSISLVEAMNACDVKNLVFSSSASVYGKPKYVPIDESHQVKPLSSYAFTKLYVENFLKDLSQRDKSWSIVVLRYFNPAGADSSGLIGESPKDNPSNLIPAISYVALGKIKKLKIYGDDYKTNDGTGIRDFIHVTDLAKGHVAALNYIKQAPENFEVFNLGTGKGNSVKEIITIYERILKSNIQTALVERRGGDIDISIADPKKANKFLNWTTKKNIEEICRSEWSWQSNRLRSHISDEKK